MSSPSTYTYETVYILDPALSDADLNSIHEKIDSVIHKFNGKLIVRDDWGVKDLEYIIHKNHSARYVVINYTGRSGVVEEVERHLKILGQVIRYISVMVEKDYDYNKLKKQLFMVDEEAKKNKDFKRKREFQYT